jgi:hypothetical protein
MHRFWPRFIAPLLAAAAPRRVMEIGADLGWNTNVLLQLAREKNFFVDIVDPAPQPPFYDVLAKYNGGYAFHQAKSLDVIGALPAADVILLDGDHNWYTVYNELQQIFLRAERQAVPPPIVIAHDVGWPYGRRDMYYDVDAINGADRQPYARRGLLLDRSELAQDGLNSHFANAVRQGGPRNGVLTAVEDFLAASGTDVMYRQLPFHFGLGLVLPAARRSAEVMQTVESFFEAPSLLETCKALERESISMRIELAACKHELTRRTDALMRARSIIVELRQEQGKKAVVS